MPLQRMALISWNTLIVEHVSQCQRHHLHCLESVKMILAIRFLSGTCFLIIGYGYFINVYLLKMEDEGI